MKKQSTKKQAGLETYQKVGVVLLVIVLMGALGWVHEFLLGCIEHGRPYMKGGNLLPWINIYAIGALAVLALTYKMRKNPLLVFFVGGVSAGAIEFVGGYLAAALNNGVCQWNYREAWWGVGNINGYVCPASVMAFGLASLILMYLVLPFCVYLARKMSKRAFLILTVTLFTLVMTEEITNLTWKLLDMPTAMDFYRSSGFEYY